MKTKLLLSLLAVSSLFATFLGAQDNPIIRVERWEYDDETMKMVPWHKSENFYSADGKIASSAGYHWNRDLNAFQKTSEGQFFYSSLSGKLERYFSTSYDENGEPTWFDETLYSYFPNGCTDQIIRIDMFPDGDTLEMRLDYYSEPGCHIDSIITVFKDISGEWLFEKKAEYFYEPLKRTVRSYWYSPDSGWVLTGESVVEEDIHGNVIRRWGSGSDFASEEERLFEYDHNNNVVAERYYVKLHENDSLRLVRETAFRNFYNDLDQLTSVESETTYYTSMGQVEFVFHYTKEFFYYCDHLLKEERGVYANQEIDESVRYYYLRGTDCEEQQDYEATVSPNPVTNLLTIESQALLTRGSFIRIVDSKGSTVYSADIPERINSHTTDLSALPSGMYFLIIDWNSGRLSKKLLKL